MEVSMVVWADEHGDRERYAGALVRIRETINVYTDGEQLVTVEYVTRIRDRHGWYVVSLPAWQAELVCPD